MIKGYWLPLAEELIRINPYSEDKVVDQFLNVLDRQLPFTLIKAAIWKINQRSNSVSLYARIGADYDSEHVYPLNGSSIGATIEHIESCALPFHVQRFDNFSLVVTPIRNYNNLGVSQISAVLDMYLRQGAEIAPSAIELIKNSLSFLMSASTDLRKTRMTNFLLGVYSKYQFTINSNAVLKLAVSHLIDEFVPSEACSIYAWNNISSDLSLAYSTGIFGNPLPESVRDYVGGGLVGETAEQKRTIIIDDITSANNIMSRVYPKNEARPKKDPGIFTRFMEITEYNAKSVILTPIFTSSGSNEVRGVLKLVNKRNSLTSCTDCFDWEDEVLLENAAKLLSFHFEQIHYERARNAFTLQMAHELLAPANAIKSTSERFIEKWNNYEILPPEKRLDYLKSIRDHARLQVALARSVELGWKKQDYPRSFQYIPLPNHLREIAEEARKIVIPICRSEGIQFDNIKIQGSFPTLHIDRFAFVQVFFNLLTNAIKYRTHEDHTKFFVQINCEAVSNYELPTKFFISKISSGHSGKLYTRVDGYIVSIADYGMGIEPAFAERIFENGFRVPDASKWSVRGSGIGLSVVRNILEDFHSNVWVSSFQNPTLFKIFLPHLLENDQYIKEDRWTHVHPKGEK
jgi:signal transduction histidine kinase